jgi:thiosulfate/3-mercaptopyruvate sulfurtransferase
MPSMATPERISTQFPVIVPADWVAERLDGCDLVVADVRWYLDGRSGRDAYRSGHIPGAVFLDIDTELSAPASDEGGRHPLPSPEDFARALGAAGIGDRTAVVAYDDSGGGSAARLVWMLRAIGRCGALLDGGLQAWPGELETGEITATPTTCTPRPWPTQKLNDATQAHNAGHDPQRLLLDARVPGRYTGEHPAPVDLRPGHIPGARNAPWQENLTPDGRFAPPEELRRRYAALGAQQAESVTAYCGSGVSACHVLLAMEHAGLSDARLYVGSWSGWQSDPERPVETGTEASP